MDIWAGQSAVIRQVLERERISASDIAAIGICNQRETSIVWDRKSAKPLYPAIVWQDRRGAEICEKARLDGMEELIRERTGLVLDSYFSASKLAWILDQVPGARLRAERGELLFGTVDTWLVWNLSAGRSHVTDASNASRSMFFNIHSLEWDQDLLDYFRIPRAMLPEICPSWGRIARTEPSMFGGATIEICGIAGDQQSALMGQGCVRPGLGKNTYGTGSFILLHTGDTPIKNRQGLLSTIAWSNGRETSYALEGSIFTTGDAVKWLRDELKVIRDARDSEYFANKVPDNGGVYLIPGFSGLGAPYWDMYARGTIVGMTRGSSMDHIIRATLESIAYQVRDVLELMEEESGIGLEALRVDGGASANDFLMQFQADILGVPVIRPANQEATALGAALMAGMGLGIWDLENAASIPGGNSRKFEANMDAERREKLYAGWKKAVARSMGWAREEA